MTEPRKITANGVDFAYLAEGESGPLALCLHGFPDTAYTFRHLLPELAAAGFRAIAPYLRGYAPTQVPADGAYSVGALATDANALHEELGADERAVLIGHDFGAVTAYATGAMAPERWRRVVTMAVPPPSALMAGLLTSYAQLKRSFYVWFFQTALAEDSVAANDMAFLDELWRDWSPTYEGSEDVARVKESLRDPANLTAVLTYYRAMFGSVPPVPAYAEADEAAGGLPSCPTLYLQGTDDGCLGRDVAEGAAVGLSPGSRVEFVDGVGHFLHLERPESVNQMIIDWVTG